MMDFSFITFLLITEEGSATIGLSGVRVSIVKLLLRTLQVFLGYLSSSVEEVVSKAEEVVSKSDINSSYNYISAFNNFLNNPYVGYTWTIIILLLLLFILVVLLFLYINRILRLLNYMVKSLFSIIRYLFNKKKILFFMGLSWLSFWFLWYVEIIFSYRLYNNPIKFDDKGYEKSFKKGELDASELATPFKFTKNEEKSKYFYKTLLSISEDLENKDISLYEYIKSFSLMCYKLRQEDSYRRGVILDDIHWTPADELQNLICERYIHVPLRFTSIRSSLDYEAFSRYWWRRSFWSYEYENKQRYVHGLLFNTFGHHVLTNPKNPVTAYPFEFGFSFLNYRANNLFRHLINTHRSYYDYNYLTIIDGVKQLVTHISINTARGYIESGRHQLLHIYDYGRDDNMEVMPVMSDSAKLVREYIISKHGEDSPILKEFDHLATNEVYYDKKQKLFCHIFFGNVIDYNKAKPMSSFFDGEEFADPKDYDNLIGNYDAKRHNKFEKDWVEFKESSGIDCTFQQWADWKLTERKRKAEFVTNQALRYNKVAEMYNNTSYIDLCRGGKTFNHEFLEKNDPFNS